MRIKSFTHVERGFIESRIVRLGSENSNLVELYSFFSNLGIDKKVVRDILWNLIDRGYISLKEEGRVKANKDWRKEGYETF